MGSAEGVRLGDGVRDGDAPRDSDDVGECDGVRVNDGVDAGVGVLEGELDTDGVLDCELVGVGELDTDVMTGHVDVSSTPNSAAVCEFALQDGERLLLTHHDIAAPVAAAAFPSTVFTTEPSLQQNGPSDANRDSMYQSDVGSSDQPYATMDAPKGHVTVVSTPAVDDPSLSSTAPDEAAMLTECTRKGTHPSEKLCDEPVSAAIEILERGGATGKGAAGGGWKTNVNTGLVHEPCQITLMRSTMFGTMIPNDDVLEGLPE